MSVPTGTGDEGRCGLCAGILGGPALFRICKSHVQELTVDASVETMG